MEIDYKSIIEKIHEAQCKTIMALTEFRNKQSTAKLPPKSRGLYWLWCKTDFSQISFDATPKGSAHVPLDVLYNTRKDLQYVCQVNKQDFTIVYNGIGGYKNWIKGSTYGLRARINQECVSNNTKTGTLNIEARGLNKEGDWKVSYFDFDDKNNHGVLKLLDSNLDITALYKKTANGLEISWRLHYGTPIFCRH